MSPSETLRSGAPAAAVGTRRTRRRAATRARLLAGAQALIARDGLDRLTIADVAEEADVGFGTFYGYFSSKEALTQAVVADALERFGADTDARTRGLDDPAEIVAAAIRHTLDLADDDPTRARFIVELAFSSERTLWAGIHRRVVRDLRAGAATGRFRLDDPAASAHLLIGAVASAVRARVEGDLPPEAAEEVTARLLVMLGVPPADASAVARRNRRWHQPERPR